MIFQSFKYFAKLTFFFFISFSSAKIFLNEVEYYVVPLRGTRSLEKRFLNRVFSRTAIDAETLCALFA